MPTRLLMIITTAFLAIVGLLLSFLSGEFLDYFDQPVNMFLVTAFQVIGALYLGFAMLNWMQKGSLIGGIYNRPVVVANLMHFGVVSVTLIKLIIGGVNESLIFMLAAIYTLFAIIFGYLLRTSPV